MRKMEYNPEAWSDWIKKDKKFENYWLIANEVEDFFRNGSTLRGIGHLYVRIMIFPSGAFKPMRCYEISSDTRTTSIAMLHHGFQAQSYMAVRTSWNEDKDVLRWNELGADNYTVGVDSAVVYFDLDQLNTIFNIFSSMNISVWSYAFAAQDNQGYDGTLYEMQFGDEWIGATYKWWSETPESWKGVHKSALKVIELLDELIGENPR